MTNLQQGAPVLSPQALRRLWFGVPAAALGLVALALMAAVLAPLWQALQRDATRLRELEDLQVQVSLMRQQLRAQDMQEEKARQQQQRLFEMIAGSGDVSTLLAVLDREAKASGVQLDLVDPQAGETPAATAATPRPPVNPNQPPPPPNPLEMAGLLPQSMLISLRGPYPNLLQFLRRLESLNLLVIQRDLRLEAPAPSPDPKKPVPQFVTMKLSLRVYGNKSSSADAQASAPAAPGTPPLAPPAATAPGAPASRPGTPAPTAPPGTPGATTPPPAANPAAPPARPPANGTPATPPQGTATPAAAPAATPPAAR